MLQDVYKSESDTNQRNQAIGALMLAYGYIKSDWRQAVDLYTRQCSIGVNARISPRWRRRSPAAARIPVTGKQVMDAAKVPDVLAVMATAGLYDDSGKWLYHTGLPGQERRRRRHHRRVAGQVRHRRRRRRRSTRPATACGRRARSPTSRTRSAATRRRRDADRRRRRCRSTIGPQAKAVMEIYGFAMLDIGHDFKQIDPNWSDTLRLTKLPKVANEFGEDNSTFAGVRQSRLGVKSSTPTRIGDLKTIFEFELFGTGVDEGQTTFRLRHAWGELGRVRRRPVPGARSSTPTCSRTRSSTGGRPASPGTETSRSAGRRSATTTTT